MIESNAELVELGLTVLGLVAATRRRKEK
jgi:hypothetical protein